jgi:hypothetical protein
MPASRKVNVRKVNGELHFITDGINAIPTGCRSKNELLDQLDIRYNYAIEIVSD